MSNIKYKESAGKLRMELQDGRCYTVSENGHDLEGYTHAAACRECAKLSSVGSAPDAMVTSTMDSIIDGVTLRKLIEIDEINQRHEIPRAWTRSQRAAVSAHWSAQLRAKVAASEVQRKLDTMVTYCEVEPWE